MHRSLDAHGGREKKKGFNRAYSRFYEGYTEYTVLDRNGKTRIERVYTAPYHVRRLDRSRERAVKAFYCLLMALMTACFVSAGIADSGMNRTLYVTLPQAVCIVFLGWMLISLAEYVPSSGNLTIYQYRSSSVSLRRASMGVGIAGGILTLGACAYLALHHASATASDGTGLVRFAAIAIFGFIANRLEASVPYDTVPNENSGVKGYQVTRTEVKESDDESGEDENG